MSVLPFREDKRKNGGIINGEQQRRISQLIGPEDSDKKNRTNKIRDAHL